MMLEIGTVLEGEGLQRVTVGFRSVSYDVVLGGRGSTWDSTSD